MNPDRPASKLTPAAFVGQISAYAPPKPGVPIDLRLDGNEGKAPPAEVLARLASADPETLKRYTRPVTLEAKLASRFGLDPAQVMVTAGADDAIDRVCRAMLGPDREIVVPIPTFEMLPRYAGMTGATIVNVPWPAGPYPRDAVQRAITSRTAIVSIITPNNPTGAVATFDDVKALAAAAPNALLLVDMVYAECADQDFTREVLTLPNAIVLRSFSKAWGLAGLRVGYAMGPAEVIRWLRVSSGPFMLSALSLLIAEKWMDEGKDHVDSYVKRIRIERKALFDKLSTLGAEPRPSQANFVLARFKNAASVRDALATRGIAVRLFEGQPELDNCLRITCPADEANFTRLLRALEEARL
ncbi:MAG: histidinol-phosphate aminotransferase family protein [Planctomycetes bacterium]|nr:histidinol-phosphate aminotransferase family protein [Planctomycetota bacterium]